MIGSVRSFACVVLALLAAVARAGDGEAKVHWKSKDVLASAPPEGFPKSALPAALRFAPWAEKRGYRLDLDDSGRVLVLSRGASAPASSMRRVDAVLSLLDEHLLPSDAPPLESGAAVLCALKTEADSLSLVEELARTAPELAAFVPKNLPGYVIEDRLVGAVVLEGVGQKEWSAEHELVHRAAELVLLRRFGHQPYWLLQGWAWHVELSVARSLYCFPYRSGFVGIGEHTGWDKLLRQDWSEPGEASIADVVALRRGSWDARAARHAWGTVTFFDKHFRGEFPALLAELRAAWDQGSRRDLGGGRWERVGGFEVDSARQLELLRKHSTPEFERELASFFRQGSAYHPAR